MSQTYTDDCFDSSHSALTDMANIENNFAALKSSFGGASAPSNTVAGMPWLDTTNHILKIRNEANTAWISIWDFATASLTASRVMVVGANGLPAASTIATTLLAYLSGLTGNVQTQLGAKLNIADDRVVKGWGKVQGTGTAAITNDFNILSITDNGTGNYTITIDTDLANANYAVVTGLDGTVGFVYFDSFAVGSFVARTHNAAAANTDRDFFFVIFGN